MAAEVLGVTPLLQVYDMPTSVRFYRDKLGFEVVGTSPPMGEDDFHWCLLRLGKAELMLNTAYEFNDERPARRGARVRAHIAIPGCSFRMSGCRWRRTRRFAAKGVEVDKPKVAPYGMKQMYFVDPDGYGLCFQWQA